MNVLEAALCECIRSGQVSAEQIEAHRAAGEFVPTPFKDRAMKTSNAFIACQCDQAGEIVEFCAAPQVKSEVDWQAVGRLLEAHNKRQLGAMVGTTNWGAMLWRAAQPVQPENTK